MIENLSSNLLEAFQSVLGAFGNIFGNITATIVELSSNI